MRSRSGLGISLTLAAGAAVAALFTATAHGDGTASTLTFVVENHGTQYVTAAGSTSVFPGRLQPGDRILTRDSLLQGARSIGYDNELCTVTLENHDLCQVMLVLPGKGQIQASWLWIRWPSNFTGVIDGGTGAFAHAGGQFTATVLRNGALKITATLR
jgi:hypothetical protein